MGGEQFEQMGRGATAREAFDKAREEAAWEHGHGGYTGTLAEKGEFRMLTVPTGIDPVQWITWVQGWDWNKDQIAAEHHAAVSTASEAVDGKWGPAGCVAGAEPGTWWFFGWASS